MSQSMREEQGAQAVQGAAAGEGASSLTQVQNLARCAARAGFEDLSPASRAQLPIHILDSLGCRIAALGAGPVQACRQQVTDFGGTGPCALITRRGFGYHSQEAVIALAMLSLGGLCPPLPGR